MPVPRQRSARAFTPLAACGCCQGARLTHGANPSCCQHPAAGAAGSPPRPNAQEHREEKVIVYALTCACVDFIAAALEVLQPPGQASTPVFALHGRMKQKARESRLAAYTAASSGARLAATAAAPGCGGPVLAAGLSVTGCRHGRGPAALQGGWSRRCVMGWWPCRLSAVHGRGCPGAGHT